MSLIRHVEIDNQPRDSFGRLTIAEPHSLFDSTFKYDLQPVIWEKILVAGGTVTHVPTRACAQLTVSTGATDSAAMQTYEHHPYQPGKSQQIAMTFKFGAAVANVRRRAGYFDANNGVFLEQDGTNGTYLVLRSNTSGSPVDTRVAQSAWSEDTLMGSGVSGITLDLSKTQILMIDAQWLGVGRVHVLFNIGGESRGVHEFLHANLATEVYCRTFNLPVRYEIANTAGSAGASMDGICSAVISSGGYTEDRGYEFSIRTPAVRNVGVGGLPVIAIRPAATFLGSVNRMCINLDSYSIASDGNQLMIVDVYYNPTTVTGGAWAAADSVNSGMEYNITATAFTGGILMDTFIIANTGSTKSSISHESHTKYPIALDATGANPRGIVVVATTISTTANVLGVIQWRETR